ncbi:ribose 5-phosphate isomerase B [Chryseobacterium taichungense]|uniref:Ribose 5-phosphate isomerase B n=2 Tax=Chryseobacterium taichungense TaxID=295069 RepID=A0A1H8CU93_9FLAO|nr:ribose 5-phosphate isomerase B [Chryseobacterium taichungense]
MVEVFITNFSNVTKHLFYQSYPQLFTMLFTIYSRKTNTHCYYSYLCYEINLERLYRTVMKRKIALAADHAGFEYKEIVKNYLSEKFEVQDFGTFSTDSVDYPDFVHPAATSVENRENELGILFCGSGNGVQITANKHQKIRCALCWMPEIASLARQHNDANMISIPARFISKELAIEIVDKFLSTDFEGGRHQNRVDKITYC